MANQEVRVRFAPSPTGHLHIGGARSALFSYLYARKNKGKFIVRFEDTDQLRNVEDAEEKLLDNLAWLGIEWDESVDADGPYGPYRCSDRIDLYKKHADELLASGHAYKCYCTSEELEVERETQVAGGITPMYSGKCRKLTPSESRQLEQEGRSANLRFAVPADQIIIVNDLVRGRIEFESNGIGDFIIMRPNGMPTYNFAVTVDDHLMKISHVIRGEEHLTNTPRQQLIYRAFGWEEPEFAHLSLILNEDRHKMSKRDETIIQFVDQYKALGFLPEAVLNFLALFGWSPEGEQEIFTKEELIEQFSLERVSKSPAVFDVNKLYWMNNHYIKESSLAEIVELCRPFLAEAGLIAQELSAEEELWVEHLVALYKDQLNYGQEIVKLSSLFFAEELHYDDEAQNVLADESTQVVLAAFYQKQLALAGYNPEEIKTLLAEVQVETGYKGKKLFMPVRVAATGQTHGPDLPTTISLLGKQKVSSRLKQLLTNLN
jgi:nondiscriminating glutamyl-tRNA synthetase